MRSAWNVRVAGWISPVRGATEASTMSASCAVVVIGSILRACDDGAGDAARERRSSPIVVDEVGELFLVHRR